MSNSLWPHGLKHARLLCPSLSPGVCSNSCPLSQWCYLTISSSISLFPFSFSVFPSIGVFSNELALLIKWQSTGVSAFTSAFSRNIQHWFPPGLTDLISLHSRGLARVVFSTTVQKLSFSMLSLLYGFSHLYMTTGKTITSTVWTFVGKLMSLLFNMLSRFVTVFLPRRKRVLIS